MPKGVRRNAKIQACFFTVGLNAALNLTHRQATMPAVGKKRRLSRGAKTALGQKANEIGNGGLGVEIERDLATAIVFADFARKVEPRTRLALEPDVANV